MFRRTIWKIGWKFIFSNLAVKNKFSFTRFFINTMNAKFLHLPEVLLIYDESERTTRRRKVACSLATPCILELYHLTLIIQYRVMFTLVGIYALCKLQLVRLASSFDDVIKCDSTFGLGPCLSIAMLICIKIIMSDYNFIILKDKQIM